MIVKETQSQHIEVVTDVLCNKCGESLKGDKHAYYGIWGIEIEGGYESTALADMERHRFDLCEACVVDLIKTFKIPSLVAEDEDHDADHTSQA